MVFPTPFVPFPSGSYGPPLSLESVKELLVPVFLFLGGLIVVISLARLIIRGLKK